MEATRILSADILDIIFDERNKAYGAYDLRKQYQRRLTKALLITLLVAVLICLTYILLGSMKPGKAGLIEDRIVTLEKVEPKEKPVAVIPPPQKTIPPPAVRMIASTPPVIVKGEVPDEEKPPLNEDIDRAKIGTVNANGAADMGIVGPPVDAAKGLVNEPGKQEPDDGIFRVVEIESQYPGGVAAWGAFLYRNLVYPQQAIDDEKEGTVYVQFIVDTEGNVSDVKAVDGPQELYAAAVGVIRKSGRWTAAIQNGRKVKSYKKQPITFRLAKDQ